jgi:hypothetical protein
MVSRLWLAGAVPLIFGTALIPATGHAAVTVVTSRSALGTDLIDWATTTGGPTPVGFTSAQGIAGTTTSAGGNLQVRQQPGNFDGDFSPGDFLEFTGFDGPDITINFNTAVAGAGAQIQANFGGAFTARITAFDGTTSWSFTESGVSGSHNDGSAIFLGVLSDSTNLQWVRFTLDSATAYPQSLAINKVSLTDSVAASIPEPASWALMLIGFGTLGCLLRSQRRAPGFLPGQAGSNQAMV